MQKKHHTLTTEEVEHIAKLSGLTLTESEIKKHQKDLSKTLDYIKLLSSLDADKIPPTYHVENTNNVTREDEIKSSLSQEETLSNAKKTYQGFFQVKAVLEEK